jgi:hypothetical protein
MTNEEKIIELCAVVHELKGKCERLENEIQWLRGLVLSQKIAPWPTAPMMPTYPSYPWYSYATVTTTTANTEAHD